MRTLRHTSRGSVHLSQPSTSLFHCSSRSSLTSFVSPIASTLSLDHSPYLCLPSSPRIHKERAGARCYATGSSDLIQSEAPVSQKSRTQDTTNILQELLKNANETTIMQQMYEIPTEAPRDQDIARLLDLLTLPIETPDPTVTLRKQEDNFDKFFATRVKTRENFRRLIQIQGSKRKFDAAIETFAKMRARFEELDPATYGSMMKVYADALQPEEAMKLFVEMKQREIDPGIEGYGCIINAYTQAKNMEKALELFSQMKKSGVAPNIVIYTDLVHGYWNIRDIEKMWETYEQMRIYDGIRPDQVMYTLLMRACAERQEVERAFNIFEEIQAMDLQPTAHTYNTLIYACAKRPDYYKEAFITLEKMKTAGFLPDLSTWNSILYASAVNADYEMAERTFQEMINQRAFDGADEDSKGMTWVTLLKAYSKAVAHETAATGEAIIKRAYDHIKLLKELGIQENLHILNSVLQLYGSSRRMANTLEFFFTAFNVKRYTAPAEAIEEDEEGGPSYFGVNKKILPWETKVVSMSDTRLNLLLLENGLSTSGSRRDLEERAVSRVKPVKGTIVEGREMSRLVLSGKDSVIEPDIRSYTILVRMFADTHRPDKALEVWRQIKEHNEVLKYEGQPDRLVPDMYTYEAMVKALAKGSYLNTAMKFIREMRAKGFIPGDNVVRMMRYQLKGYPEQLEELNRLVAIPPSKVPTDYQGHIMRQTMHLRHPVTSPRAKRHLQGLDMTAAAQFMLRVG